MTEEGRKYRLEDIFDAPSISQGITKNFCQENKGDIPVFGSSKYLSESITRASRLMFQKYPRSNGRSLRY